MTLYELDTQFKMILWMAESEDLDPETIAGTLEGLEGEIEVKLDSYGIVINELQEDIEKIDREIKRLTENKKRIKTNIDRMKAAVMNSMEIMDTRKVQGEHFTWQIQKNGGKAPLVLSDDFNIMEIPEAFQLWDVKPNNEAIRKALETGEELSFARLGERGESLRLK